ncbi:purine permease [Micrococcales bacterium 31B]|nr:purine permease [Micrococcales bacterium 31B]
MANSNGAATPARAPQNPEDQRLPLLPTFGYGLQHVLTMYAGIIVPPLLIGQAAGLGPDTINGLITCCLFVGGLATILQSIGLPFFGSKLPLVQGVTFASVGTLIAIVAPHSANGTGEQGLREAFGAVLAASLIGLIIAPFFARLVKFFPQVVQGIVITTIGVSLLPVAIGWITGPSQRSDGAGGLVANPDYASVRNIGWALLTLAVILVLSKLKNATISRMSILLGLLLCTTLALPFGLVNASAVGRADIFALPTPLQFGAPSFANVGGIIGMTVVILVVCTETTADILAVSQIVGTTVDRRRIADGLRADMASSAISSLFNSFPQTAFAQNVGLVALTGVKSRFVVSASGAILVVLGLFPVMGALIQAIPQPVLGGAGLVLFGTVAASGIRTLAQVNYAGTMNLIIVGVSLAMGLVPTVSYDQFGPNAFWHNFPDWFQTVFHSGITSAAVTAMVLNLVFNHFRAGNAPDGSVFTAAAERQVDAQLVRQLRRGDHFDGEKLIDKDGNEIVGGSADH